MFAERSISGLGKFSLMFMEEKVLFCWFTRKARPESCLTSVSSYEKTLSENQLMLMLLTLSHDPGV